MFFFFYSSEKPVPANTLDRTSTVLKRTRAYRSKDPAHLRSILRQYAQVHSLRTFKRTSPTRERTCAATNIIIAFSAPTLNQLKYKLECMHATGSTIDGSAHQCLITPHLHSSILPQTAIKRTSTWNFAKLMFGLFCEFLFLIFGVFVYFISKKTKTKKTK